MAHKGKAKILLRSSQPRIVESDAVRTWFQDLTTVEQREDQHDNELEGFVLGLTRAMLEQIPGEYLASPLEYIFADNYRCRAMCSLLRLVGEGRVVDNQARAACRGFLQDAYTNHVADERDLFLLLFERGQLNETAFRALDKSRPQHAEIASLCPSLGADAPSEPASGIILEFVYRERQHIALENVVLLQTAREQLSGGELAGMAKAMWTRRLVAALSAR